MGQNNLEGPRAPDGRYVARRECIVGKTHKHGALTHACAAGIQSGTQTSGMEAKKKGT